MSVNRLTTGSFKPLQSTFRGEPPTSLEDRNGYCFGPSSEGNVRFDVCHPGPSIFSRCNQPKVQGSMPGSANALPWEEARIVGF